MRVSGDARERVARSHGLSVTLAARDPQPVRTELAGQLVVGVSAVNCGLGGWGKKRANCRVHVRPEACRTTVRVAGLGEPLPPVADREPVCFQQDAVGPAAAQAPTLRNQVVENRLRAYGRGLVLASDDRRLRRPVPRSDRRCLACISARETARRSSIVDSARSPEQLDAGAVRGFPRTSKSPWR